MIIQCKAVVACHSHQCCTVLQPQTEKFYDMLGTGSFAALSIGSWLASKNNHARKASHTQDHI